MSRGQIQLAGGIAALLGLLVAIQILLPLYAENYLERRLTKHGGTAKVDVDAFPAERLVFRHGDLLRIRARDLRFGLEERGRRVFRELNRFGRVDVRMQDVSAGPFSVSRFDLESRGHGEYSLAMSAAATPSELGSYAGSHLGGGLGGLLGGLAGRALGGGTIPIEADMTLESGQDGRAHVTSGGGTVAGIPTGPLAELLTNSVLARL